jgi:hypothetical protein
MDEHVIWWRKKILARTAKALEANGFTAVAADTLKDAASFAADAVPAGSTVGLGGSMSVRELGLAEMLSSRGHGIIMPLAGMSREDALAKRRAALSADVYLASPQAVTVDGKLIFVDMHANRTAAVSFGPSKVVLVAGFNKIAFDEAAGIFRARNVAAPINVRRLGRKTPCAETGLCSDCDSEGRICRVVEVILKKPGSTEICVVLCAQDLGY